MWVRVDLDGAAGRAVHGELGLLTGRGTVKGTGTSAVTFTLDPWSRLAFASHPRRMARLCQGGTRLPVLAREDCNQSEWSNERFFEGLGRLAVDHGAK